jgi:hypothetical protein
VGDDAIPGRFYGKCGFQKTLSVRFGKYRLKNKASQDFFNCGRLSKAPELENRFQ